MAGKTIFEHKPCSRCGGSGRYSFNLMHGSMCYGCNGRGYQLTKRGAAARAYYNNLLTCDWSELQSGMKFLDEFAGRWLTVVKVDHEAKTVTYNERGDVWDFSHERSIQTVRRKPINNDEWKEIKAQALAYQATLTAQGKPRKRQRK